MVPNDRAVGLRPPGADSSLLRYTAEMWRMRSYAWENGLSGVRASNAGTNLGAVWLFLEPVFSIAIYWAIFGWLLQVSRGVDDYLAFLTVGQIYFGLALRSVVGASGSLTSQAPMLRSLAFPRATLPLSEVLKAIAAFRAELVVMLVAIVIMGIQVSVRWLLLPLVALGLGVFSFGIGLALARIVHKVPDVQRLITHVMRLAFYASGVFYPLSSFVSSESVISAAHLNPWYSYLELARWAAMERPMDRPVLAPTLALAWTVLALTIGGWYFVRAEHTYSGARTVQR